MKPVMKQVVGNATGTNPVFVSSFIAFSFFIASVTAVISPMTAEAGALLKNVGTVPPILRPKKKAEPVRPKPTPIPMMSLVPLVGPSTNLSTVPLNSPSNVPSPSPAPGMPSILTSKFTDAEVNACLVASCGPAASNWAFADSILARKVESTGFTKLWTEQILPVITTSITLDQQKNLTMLDRLDALISAGTTPPANSPVQAYITMGILTAKYSQKLSAAMSFDAATLRLQVNETVLKDTIAEITDVKEQAVVQLIFDRIYRPIIAHTSLMPTQNPLLLRLQLMYPGVKPADALKTDAQQLITQLKNVRTRFGEVLFSELIDDLELSIFNRASQGEDLSPSDSQIYVETVSRIEMSAPSAEPDFFATLLAIPVDFTTVFDGIKKNGLIQGRRDKFKARQTTARIDSIAKSCRVRLNVALASRPSDLDFRQIDGILTEIRAAGKTVAERLLIPAVRPVASQIIAATEFVMPADPDVAVKKFQFQVQKSLSKGQMENRLLTNGSKEMDDFLLVSAPFLLVADMDTEEITTACQAVPVDSISDFTLTSMGRVQLSWFTVVYHDVGMGIAAHELGHVVSAGMRAIGAVTQGSPTYLASLNCVANRNPFVLTPVSLGYANNSTWSEEDWADHFSSMVLNEMSQSPSSWARFSKNVGCALINDDGDLYAGNKLEPAADDPHSAGLYRILMIGVDRGQLAPACQGFVAYGATKNRQLTCN